MSKWVGKHVILGVRPEHLHLAPVDEGSKGAKIDVKVSVIEPLGNDMDVYMTTTYHNHVVGRLEAQSGVQPNSTATVYADSRKMQFFEPGEVGTNLSPETRSVMAKPLSQEPAHAVA
jgi:ABC-type sugar transport system ATPase subunit